MEILRHGLHSSSIWTLNEQRNLEIWTFRNAKPNFVMQAGTIADLRGSSDLPMGW
jgi:hypothetical protein